MLKRILLTLLLLGCAVPAWAECPGEFTPMRSSNAGSYTQTVSNSSTALTIPSGAEKAVVSVESNSIRWYDDNQTPTASTGTLSSAPVEVEVCRLQMSRFRMIRATGTDASVSVRFYQ